MSTSALTLPQVAATRSRWIINRREDLIWFIGSALAGYLALLVLMVGTPAAGMIFATAWMFFINGPHFYATATRTYFDRGQRRKLSWLLLLVVPLALLPFPFVRAAGVPALVVLASLWGTFHIAKQHVGVVMLYRRKAGEVGKTDLLFDKHFLLASQMMPLALFLLWYVGVNVSPLLLPSALCLQLALGIVYVARLWVKRGAGLNVPKLTLMSLYLPLHWLALFCTLTKPTAGLIVFTISTNIGHALQYHRLTWFHNRNRYSTPEAQARAGFAALLGRRASYYYIAAFGLYLVSFLLTQLFQERQTGELLLIGPTFMHYLLDTKIWRTREDKELARALNLI